MVCFCITHPERNEKKNKNLAVIIAKNALRCVILLSTFHALVICIRVKTSRYLPGKTISAKHILASLKFATVTSCCATAPPTITSATSSPASILNVALLHPFYTVLPPQRLQNIPTAGPDAADTQIR